MQNVQFSMKDGNVRITPATKRASPIAICVRFRVVFFSSISALKDAADGSVSPRGIRRRKRTSSKNWIFKSSMVKCLR